MRSLLLLAVVALVLGPACERSAPSRTEGAGRTRIVFVHQPLWGDPASFRALLGRFEQANPDVELVTQLIPSATDVAHQYFLTALEGGSSDFDVLVADVVWVAEFAKAGWIADLSAAFPPAELRARYLPGPLEATVLDGRTWAVPWFADVGLLYYRSDLVPRAPRTYAELESAARAAMTKVPGIEGYLWQGRQYEGLNCNVAEAVWGHGGDLTIDSRVVVDSSAARAALTTLGRFVSSGVSPASVTSATEEDSRRAFQAGRAVFMRNWPYAWASLQAADSPVRGKVAFTTLPTTTGEPGSGALGGWQLALNAHTPASRREAATRLIAHLASAESSLHLALHHARVPARIDVLEHPRLRAEAPFLAGLRPMLEHARPRPVTPYYLLISDVLQGEFSAAIVGLRPPAEALGRAQKLIDHITGADL